MMNNKCNNCCKRVGLLGFKCRCASDKVWCSECRFPKIKPTDANGHNCNVDYRQLARENVYQAVVASKVDKI